MDIRSFYDSLQKNASSASPMNEALDTPAFEFLPKMDSTVRWGYIPEKEYNGQRVCVIEISDNVWGIMKFEKGNVGAAKIAKEKKASAKPAPAPAAPAPAAGADTKSESKNSTKEILRLMELSESMLSDGSIKYHKDYRFNLNEGQLTLSKIEGPGKDAIADWVFLSGAKYDFENCLKACVEIVTGKPVEGGVTTLGMLKA